jgi:hypothetical protein
MNFKSQFIVAAALIATGASAFAQATIDHNKALAGNVTPNDSAGYPITITQPGHYVLKSNLVVPAGNAGIVVLADNVTIDLNGFSIVGPGSCTRNATSYAVTCTGYTLNVNGVSSQGNALVLRNGRIQGFYAGVLTASNTTGEDLVLSENNIGLQATVAGPNGHGVTRLIRSHVSMSNMGVYFFDDGIVVTDSVFSRNNKAAQAPSGTGSFSNSSVMSNVVGFDFGNFGLHGVFMRDNKTNSIGTVFAY